MSVALRPIDETDADRIVSWRRRPEIHDQMFAAEPPDLASHRRWFERYQQGNDREELVIESDGRPVGTIGLSNIDRINRRAEYGVLIGDPECRGRGVAFAASRLILARAFDGLGLGRVYLQVFADNRAALALYERLHFVREGILRRHVIKNGVARDVVLMGLLVEEFRAARPSAETAR